MSKDSGGNWVGDAGQGVKTNNTHMDEKVVLRVLAVTELGEPRDIHVLDAYHGGGNIWRRAEQLLPAGWKVHIFAADHQAVRASTLRVDNARLLASLNLARFDLIDLDAYGWPVQQLIQVATKAPDTPVLTTRITKAIGRIPGRVLHDVGITLPKDPPYSLMLKIGDEVWEAWLHHLGYRRSRLFRVDDGPLSKRYELLTR